MQLFVYFAFFQAVLRIRKDTLEAEGDRLRPQYGVYLRGINRPTAPIIDGLTHLRINRSRQTVMGSPLIPRGTPNPPRPRRPYGFSRRGIRCLSLDYFDMPVIFPNSRCRRFFFLITHFAAFFPNKAASGLRNAREGNFFPEGPE